MTFRRLTHHWPAMQRTTIAHSPVMHSTGELKKAFDGRQTADSFLASRDLEIKKVSANLVKFCKERPTAVIKLAK